jgi:hypothetical protein
LAGTIKCGHCGKDHAEGTTFCPETGKSLGPAAGAKKTMLMFQQPGARLPGSSAPAGTPPATSTPPHGPPTGTPGAHPRPHLGSAAAPTLVGTPAVIVPQQGTGAAQRPVPHTSSAGIPARSTPSAGVPTRSTPSSGIPTRSTPSGGVPVPGSSRPSRPIQIPIPTASPKEVPPPPVFNDGVPPPITTPPQGVPTGEQSGASGPRRAKSVPEWVAEPQAGSGGHIPSVMLPAVDAPPRAVMDLLKDAFNLYKRHLQVFLITAAVLFVPGAIVSSGLLAAIFATLAAGSGSMFGIVAVAVAGLGWAMVAFVLYGLVLPLTSAALTIAVADRMLGGERGWQDYWRMLVARLGRLLSAVIPAALLVLAGTILVALPGLVLPFFLALVPIVGLVLCFFFAFVPAVVLVEGRGGMAAVKRSFELVLSDWLRVLLVFVVFGAINFIAHMVGGLLIPDRFVFLDRLMGDLVTLVLLPIPVLAAVLLYLDIRRKKEGADRETLQAELDAVRTAT